MQTVIFTTPNGQKLQRKTSSSKRVALVGKFDGEYQIVSLHSNESLAAISATEITNQRWTEVAPVKAD